jgi:hypothetical protein
MKNELATTINVDKNGIPTNEYNTPEKTANYLHTNTESIIALINIGVFENVQKPGKKYHIPTASIEDFKKNYIFASELAFQTGLPTKTISTAMRKHNIVTAVCANSIWFPSFYLRSETDIFPLETLKRTRQRHPPKGITDISWLNNMAADLPMNARSLKALIVDHFKWHSPFNAITETQISLLKKWRRTHFTTAEVCDMLAIKQQELNSRFICTKFISTQILGILTFVNEKDIFKMAHNLNTYYSTSQAAAHFCIGATKIKALVKSGKLKSALPLISEQGAQLMILKQQKLL